MPLEAHYNFITPSPSVERPSDIEVIDMVNILDVKDLSSKAKAVGITVDEDDYISGTSGDGRSWAYENSNWFKKLKAGTYTVIVFVKNKPTSTNALMHIYKNGETTSIGNINHTLLQSSVAKVQFTLSEDSEIGIMFKVFDGIFRTMLVEGTVLKPYLPYGTIGLLQRGKNFFDLKDEVTDLNYSGIKLTTNKNRIKYNGTNTIGDAINPNGWGYAPLKYNLPAGNYIFSLKKISGSYNKNGVTDAMYLRDEDKKPILDELKKYL